MKKFTDGVRRKMEIVGVCVTILSSSILSMYTVPGKDDKAKNEEVKLANTFIEDDDQVKEFSADFQKIAKIVERYSSTTLTTSALTTVSTTSTTVLTTTTVTESTTAETTTTILETEKKEEVEESAEVHETVAEQYEESENTECNDNDCNDECAEVTENIVQSSGDIYDYISDSDYILLCNAVAHEYGSDWVSIHDKALVVEVIMNRVNSASYPGTIYGVLTQQYQFSGAWSYVNLGCFSYQVTESVKESVLYYFQHPDEFTHGYYSFNGDGYRNYFR